ncbi:hypothetical protein LTR53_002015 [Teratosphaeriaceae sp. CCFEE 6253]|nr:hypothetical protein LTR53_002015 [Teratosphaeriaceae sp. CCFEE 6253]
MLANLITRGLQIVFGAVVLGLSITAIQWQHFGSAPATSSYSAFAGAFAILAGLIGIAAGFFDAIPQLIMAIVDGLASLLLLAGGIAFAVGLKGVRCSNNRETAYSFFLNGGCHGKNDNKVCGIPEENWKGVLEGRCKTVYADTVFLFFGFAACVAAAALCFIASRRSGGGIKRSSRV